MLIPLRQQNLGGTPGPPPAPSPPATSFVYRKRVQRNQQPNDLPAIDRSNELSKKLVGALSGHRVIDLVSNAVGLNVGGATYGRNNKYGRGAIFNGGSHFEIDNFASRNAFNIVGDITIIWAGVIDSVADGSTYPTIVAKTDSVGGSANGANNCPYDLHFDTSSGYLTLVRSNAANFNSWIATTTIPTSGALTTVVVRFGSDITSAPTIWINSIVQSITATSFNTSGVATGNTSPLTIGARGDGAPVYMNGSMNFLMLWSRQLTDQEVKKILANPWQVFTPTWKYIGAKFYTATGGTTYTITVTAALVSLGQQLRASQAIRMATSPLVSSLLRATAANRAASSVLIGTATKSPSIFRAAPSPLTASLTFGKALFRTLAASSPVVAVLATSNAFLRTLAGTTAPTATTSKAVSATRTAGTSPAGALVRMVTTTRSAASALLGTLSRTQSVTRSAASPLAATTSKSTSAARSAVVLTLPQLTKLTKLTRAATSALLGTITRGAQNLLRTISGSTTVVASTTKTTNATRAGSSPLVATLNIGKALFRTLAAVTPMSASLAFQKVLLRTLIAALTLQATLARSFSISRSAVISPVAVLLRQLSLSRTISATSSAAPTLIRQAQAVKMAATTTSPTLVRLKVLRLRRWPSRRSCCAR